MSRMKSGAWRLVEAGDLDVDVGRLVAERDGQRGVAVGGGRHEAGGVGRGDGRRERELRLARDIDFRAGRQLGRDDDLRVAGRAIELDRRGLDGQASRRRRRRAAAVRSRSVDASCDSRMFALLRQSLQRVASC